MGRCRGGKSLLVSRAGRDTASAPQPSPTHFSTRLAAQSTRFALCIWYQLRCTRQPAVVVSLWALASVTMHMPSE